MTRFRLSLLALPLFLLAFAVLANHKAAAQEDDSAPVQAEKPAIQPRTYLTLEELDALEAMSQEEQQGFFTQRRTENEALPDEDRQAKREARRAAFDALPAAEQATIKERTQQLMDTLYTAPPRDPEAEEAAAKKNVADFLRNLTPAQKSAFEEIRKNNKKWEKARKNPTE